jgi:hypothetical protein
VRADQLVLARARVADPAELAERAHRGLDALAALEAVEQELEGERATGSDHGTD